MNSAAVCAEACLPDAGGGRLFPVIRWGYTGGGVEAGWRGVPRMVSLFVLLLF